MEKAQVLDEMNPRFEKDTAYVKECLKTTMEAFDNYKKGYESMMDTLENENAKIKESIKMVVKTSRGVIGSTVEIFKNMISSFEEQFQLKEVVDVEANIEHDTSSGPNKRTRDTLKRKELLLTVLYIYLTGFNENTVNIDGNVFRKTIIYHLPPVVSFDGLPDLKTFNVFLEIGNIVDRPLFFTSKKNLHNYKDQTAFGLSNIWLGVGMHLATDVFIPEDYAKSRYSRKMCSKQQHSNSTNLTDACSTNGSFSQKNENPPNISGNFNKEEILFSCFTP
ncbi:uncharacterized protein LOC131858041 [Cryptomeria japonica]|uniref:uncharacterized protein LOC131858041 n=1 Tax=Cryptomeria japonica TaxID=3369 RepID=UPI0027DA8270|nr:uncharacterized protein LOC131858041 [Cryptomeria japonica]